MSDYEAVYDAVSEAFGMVDHRIVCGIQDLVYQYERPSTMMRPKLYIDGDQWCAIYGENIQDGLCGFGSSPCEALVAFDQAFYKKLPKKSK